MKLHPRVVAVTTDLETFTVEVAVAVMVVVDAVLVVVTHRMERSIRTLFLGIHSRMFHLYHGRSHHLGDTSVLQHLSTFSFMVQTSTP